jgi:hypothetical protein
MTDGEGWLLAGIRDAYWLTQRKSFILSDHVLPFAPLNATGQSVLAFRDSACQLRRAPIVGKPQSPKQEGDQMLQRGN